MSLGDISDICVCLLCGFGRCDLCFRDGCGSCGLLLDDIKLEVEEPPGESSEG